MRRGVFVTGTDTGVGKTLAACALIHALAARGVRPVPMKPIAAGATGHHGVLANDDTRDLIAAAGLDASWHDAVTPVLLAEPMAPHIAAAREGRTLSLDFLGPALSRLESAGDFLVVEGVGGFRVLWETSSTPWISRARSRCRWSWWSGCASDASITRCSPPRRSTPRGCDWPVGSRTRSTRPWRCARRTSRRSRRACPRPCWDSSRIPRTLDARALSAALDVRPLLA